MSKTKKAYTYDSDDDSDSDYDTERSSVGSVDSDESSESNSDSETKVNYFEKIKTNPKKVLSKMDYENRIGFLNQMKTTVSYFLANSRSTLFDVILFFVFAIMMFRFNNWVPRLPIGRFIPDNEFQTTLTYKSFFEKTGTLTIILLILKKLLA